MAKYSYPAIFTPEGNDVYSVLFPDIDGCYTFGDSLMLFDHEIENRPIPKPSNIKDISTKEEEFVSLIMCDTIEYQKMHNKRAIKKTLTIPEWLNEAASAASINFSQVLQEALLNKLNL